MDTYDAQQKEREKVALKTLRQREWVALGIFLAIALIVAFNIKRVEVKGHSMETSYFNGDTVIVWKTAPRAALKPGDVIVFRSTDGDELIKRIVFIANPSAPVQFPPLGFPTVVRTPAGPIDPGFGFDGYFAAVGGGFTPAPPRQSTIYVMGDNYMISSDSREFGPIDPKQILGKVIP
jgi:signal peptidase I